MILAITIDGEETTVSSMKEAYVLVVEEMIRQGVQYLNARPTKSHPDMVRLFDGSFLDVNFPPNDLLWRAWSHAIFQGMSISIRVSSENAPTQEVVFSRPEPPRIEWPLEMGAILGGHSSSTPFADKLETIARELEQCAHAIREIAEELELPVGWHAQKFDVGGNLCRYASPLLK